MKLVLLVAALLAAALICGFIPFIMLYAGMSLAAANAVRMVPYIGGLAADRMIAWVEGASEELTAEYGPLDEYDPEYDPEEGVVPWDGTIIVGDPELGVPQGKPTNGPTKWFFREPRYPRHTGVDISVPVGTPVRSTMAGVVRYAGWSPVGYGYLVIIENGDYQTYYAHLSSIGVQVGQQVGAGQEIALSGDTGNSTGPHLHYEVRVRGRPVDPCLYGAC